MIWNKEYIYNTGYANGYPKCCIDAYYLDLINFISPASKRKIDNSGFIPCQKHYKEYKEKLRCLEALCRQKERKDRNNPLFGNWKLSAQYKPLKKVQKYIAEGFDELGLLEHLIG